MQLIWVFKSSSFFVRIEKEFYKIKTLAESHPVPHTIKNDNMYFSTASLSNTRRVFRSLEFLAKVGKLQCLKKRIHYLFPVRVTFGDRSRYWWHLEKDQNKWRCCVKNMLLWIRFNDFFHDCSGVFFCKIDPESTFTSVLKAIDQTLMTFYSDSSPYCS